MPLYNLIEYSDNYSKISGSLWQYYTDEPFINNNGVIVDVPDHLDSASFKYKQEITRNNWAKDAEIMLPLKYLSIFWRTLEMPLINCKINFFFNLVWGMYLAGSVDNQEPKFAITETKRYVLVVTAWTQDNAKLLQQWKTGFKKTIKWNRYQSKPTLQTRNRYLNYLSHQSFKGANALFVLSFENDTYRRSYKRYFLSTVERKDSMLWLTEKTFLIS